MPGSTDPLDGKDSCFDSNPSSFMNVDAKKEINGFSTPAPVNYINDTGIHNINNLPSTLNNNNVISG